MNSVETEGKSVEAAVEAACEQLGIDPKDAAVEVLQEPRGLLGMTTRPARVRVSAKGNGEAAQGARDDTSALRFRKDDEPDDEPRAGARRAAHARPGFQPHRGARAYLPIHRSRRARRRARRGGPAGTENFVRRVGAVHRPSRPDARRVAVRHQPHGGKAES
ncbi:MAG: Jag N-terminal domain-containing protein [Deltaproteobacteria bacterium]|nr:Jag N-terminal domain-containing protein [Deltaproteobacteria bacterium]